MVELLLHSGSGCMGGVGVPWSHESVLELLSIARPLDLSLVTITLS